MDGPYLPFATAPGFCRRVLDSCHSWQVRRQIKVNSHKADIAALRCRCKISIAIIESPEVMAERRRSLQPREGCVGKVIVDVRNYLNASDFLHDRSTALRPKLKIFFEVLAIAKKLLVSW